MKKRISFFICTALSLIITISSCTAKNKEITIALSKASGSEAYERYSEWITSLGKNVRTIDLSALPMATAVDTLAHCSGIIFTGGADYHPGRYGKAEDSVVCEIEPQRDTLDYALMQKAVELELPILGICRGEQLINIYFGGTLDPDIKYGQDEKHIHQCKGEPNCDHDINVDRNSQLFSITKADAGVVNSNHHQAVARPGNGLKISAMAPDAVVEAIEWADPKGKPFLLGVEWHPERMNASNPFGNSIGKAFLKASEKYSKKKK